MDMEEKNIFAEKDVAAFNEGDLCEQERTPDEVRSRRIERQSADPPHQSTS